MGCVRYSGCMYVRVSPPPLTAAVVVAVPATATARVTSLVVRSEWELSARARDRGSGHTLVRDTRSPCCQRRQKPTARQLAPGLCGPGWALDIYMRCFKM